MGMVWHILSVHKAQQAPACVAGLFCFQAANSGISGHFWPPVPKHMRTITEDSLEYRLDASLGASRPSSRGGQSLPVNGTRNSSSSGNDGSPSAAATRSAHAAALAAAQANGSVTNFLSSDGSNSSSAVLQGAGTSGSSGAALGPSALSRSSTATATLAPPAVAAAAGAEAAASTGPLRLLGVSAAQAAAEDGSGTITASAGASRAPSLGGSFPAQHASREAAQLRASITSLDSIDECSSLGTCIIHNSAPSSPGLEGCSLSSREGSPMPDDQGADSSANDISAHGSSGRVSMGNSAGRDISFAGGAAGSATCGSGGVCLQGAFAEAAMAAGSSSGGSSRSGSEQVAQLDDGVLAAAGSGEQLQSDLEATLKPVSQEEVSITVLEVDSKTGSAAGSGSISSSSVSGSEVKRHRKERRAHAYESSVDFSKQHLPDLSHMDVTLLDPEQEGLQRLSSMQDKQAGASEAGIGPARWSPFAKSDGIASSIAAAGVALIANDEPWGRAAAETAAEVRAGKPSAIAASSQAKGVQQGSSSRGQRSAAANLKQQAIQLTHVQQPQQQTRAGPQIGVQSAFAQAAQQPQQPSPRQEQQQQQQLGKVSLHGSQQSLNGRSQYNSSNGSTTTSTSSRQQRQRVQQPSLHSSSEPSPVSQAGIPPCWSASWQHQQAQAQLRAGLPQGNPSSSSNNTSRAMSPVDRSFLTLQTQAVAGAAVGAGQELTLTPAALAAAAGGAGTMADAAAERLQQMLQEGLDLQGGHDPGKQGLERRVAYHWWKDLPAEQLRKCDSLVSDQNAWMDVRADEPLLAKPSVRFRKTINTYRVGPDGQRYDRIAVNAQHYAVLVTDVQPRCPYPEMEG